MQRLSVIFLCIALIITGSSLVTNVNGEWTTFHKDLNRSGFLLEEPGPMNPTFKWSFETGGYVYTSPILYEGKVYVGSGDSSFYCLEAETGTEIWSFETGDTIQGTASISDGWVYLPSYDDNLYCLDAETGEEKWAFPANGDIFSSPGVDSGLVVFGCSNFQVYAVDADDGTQVWSFLTSAAVWASPNIEDGRVYCGAGSNFYCLNLDTGTMIWTSPLGEFIIATAAVQYQEVYVATSGNTLSGTLYLLDGRTGQPLWAYQDPEGAGFFSSPAISVRMVVIGSDSGYVHCVERDSGAFQWSYDAGDLVQSSPAIANGFVYVGCDDGTVHCIDFETGLGVWVMKVSDEQVRSSPCIEDGKLWIGSWDGFVHCIEEVDGEAGGPGQEEVSISVVEPSNANMSADSEFLIRCEISTNDLNDTMALYYSPEKNESRTQLIVEGTVSEITGMYAWDTRDIDPGTYWIKAELTSGAIQVTNWSLGSVLVEHPVDKGDENFIPVGTGGLELMVLFVLISLIGKRKT